MSKTPELVRNATSPLGKKIRVLHEKWKEILGIAHWHDESYLGGRVKETWAEVQSAQWEYLRFKVMYSQTCDQLSPEMLEWTVVHELCHVVLSPNWQLTESLIDNIDDDDAMTASTRELSKRLDERVTTELAYALLRARQPSLDASTS